MSKYEFTLRVLGEKLQEVGGELYTLELMKNDKNGAAMAAMFGGLMGVDNNKEHFDELIEAMKLLKGEADAATRSDTPEKEVEV